MPDLVITSLRSHAAAKTVAFPEIDQLLLPGSEITGLTGPSGSGKTLLFRAIADLDPSEGQLSLDSIKRETVAAHSWRSRVCYVPTESAWWCETVGGHFPENADLEYLHSLGFERDVMSWSISRLSSGEKQRLALLRCLARRPAALLLDEPTASLDGLRTGHVEQVISTYAVKNQAPVFWISHDLEQLARISSRVLTIQDDGRLGELSV